MKKQTWLAYLRIALGLLGLSAVTTQLVVNIERGNNIANFFSFFTIESNILAGLLFVIIGICTLKGIKKNIGFLRGAATLYMTMTGVIYVLLLSNTPTDALQTTLPWVNTVIHYILPVAILLDWLLFPPTSRITFKKALWWITYPLIYFVYSLIRGSITEWYPYPFINPIINGWQGVIITTAIIAASTILLIWLLALRTFKNSVK